MIPFPTDMERSFTVKSDPDPETRRGSSLLCDCQVTPVLHRHRSPWQKKAIATAASDYCDYDVKRHDEITIAEPWEMLAWRDAS